MNSLLVKPLTADGFFEFGDVIEMDQRASIAAVETPTLVIVGDSDPSTTPEAARFIHERIAGSQLRVLPDAAHLSNVAAEAAFNETLIAFLTGHV